MRGKFVILYMLNRSTIKLDEKTEVYCDLLKYFLIEILNVRY